MNTNTVPSALAGGRAWAGLAVLALPTLLVSMDMTVLYLAVPALSEALRPGSAQLLWITDIYGFMEAGLLITMGMLGDRIGRRKLLIIGAIAFTIASALAAFSKTAEMLIGARALLGIAGATLLPSILSLIRNMFHDENQRTQALGIWTMCFSVGTMLGPLAGGFLLHHFWWGSVFLMGVPIMLLFLILGPLVLPESRDPGSGRFDLVSVALLLTATFPFIYGVKQMAAHGLDWLPMGSVIAGLIIGRIFLHRQQRLTDPLVDLSLFRIPAFRAAQSGLFLCLFCWVGISLYVAQHFQLILGMNPFRAGLWILPGAATGVVGCLLAPLAVRLLPRAAVMTTSMIILGLGLLILSPISEADGVLRPVCAMVVLCLGCSVTVTLCHDLVMSAAPPRRAGAAAGISETSATYGGAFGIALLGSIGTFIYHSRMAGALPGGLTREMTHAAENTLGGALEVAGKLTPQQAAPILNTAHASFLAAFRLSSLLCAVLMLAAAIVVAFLLRAGKERAHAVTQ